jgi:alpha-galactosidase
LFNTNTAFTSVTVNWVDLGFSGSADVRDLWAHQDMGTSATGYTVNLNAHASALLRVRPQSDSQSENVFGCGR